VIAEWHGKGDRVSFATRAQVDWRKAWDTQERTGVAGEHEAYEEPLSSMMVTILLLALVAYAWKEYGDIFQSFLDGNI